MWNGRGKLTPFLLFSPLNRILDTGEREVEGKRLGKESHAESVFFAFLSLPHPII